MSLACPKKKNFDVNMWKTIQVGKNLFCLSDRNLPEFKMYGGLDNISC